MTKPAQSKLWAGCSEQAHDCGLALTPGPREPSQLYPLVPLVLQEKLNCSSRELSRVQAQFSAAICSGTGQSTQHSPTTLHRQAASWGAGHKGLAAASGLAAPGEYFIFSVQ